MEETLAFVAGERNEDVSGGESDLFSWLLLNSDLVPMNSEKSPSRRPLQTSQLGSDINLLQAANDASNRLLPSIPSAIHIASDDKKQTSTSTTTTTAKGKTRNTRKSSTNSGTIVPVSTISGGTTTSSNNSRKNTPESSPAKPLISPTNAKTTTSAAKKFVTQEQQDDEDMMLDDQDMMNDDDFKNLTAEQKRLRRLEKNREIAKNCRKRKREKIGALEEELTRLREWNRQLEKKLNQTDDGVDREDIRLKEMNEITHMVQNKVTEAEIRRKLEVYKEVYSDFGKERRVAISYHLEQLKALLLPNQVSKMTLWSLEQDDEFYDEKKNQNIFGGGIWNTICAELELTDEQKKALVEMRRPIRIQRDNVGECLRILAELEKRVEENFNSMTAQMSTLMQTIAPMQQAKFLIWIENNQPAMLMLNSLTNFHARTNESPSDSAQTGDDDDNE